MLFCSYISDLQRFIIWIPLAILIVLIPVITTVSCIVIKKLRKRFVSPDIRRLDCLISYDPDSHINGTHGWHSPGHGETENQLWVQCGSNRENPALQLFWGWPIFMFIQNDSERVRIEQLISVLDLSILQWNTRMWMSWRWFCLPSWQLLLVHSFKRIYDSGFSL